MDKPTCSRCGNRHFEKGFISLRCPICGDIIYMKDADDSLLWAEHRLGMLFKTGGFHLMDLIEAPDWFFERVA